MLKTFPGRPLLRRVSVVVGVMILALQAALVTLALLRPESPGVEIVWALVPILLIPGLFVLKKLNDSYGTLEVDERGIRLRRPVGRVVSLPWEQVGSVRHWETIQMVHGGRSREYFLDVMGVSGRRLLHLKSTFEREAYVCVLDQARVRKIQVDLT